MYITYETKYCNQIILDVEYQIDGYYDNRDCGGTKNDFTVEITGIFYKKSGKSVGDLVFQYLTNSKDFIKQFEGGFDE